MSLNIEHWSITTLSCHKAIVNLNIVLVNCNLTECKCHMSFTTYQLQHGAYQHGEGCWCREHLQRLCPGVRVPDYVSDYHTLGSRYHGGPSDLKYLNYIGVRLNGESGLARECANRHTAPSPGGVEFFFLLKKFNIFSGFFVFFNENLIENCTNNMQ